MQDEYLGIKIDYDRDSLFSESGLSRLKQGYMTDAETSPQQRFAFVANEFASNKEHAQRMYDYISQMFVSCSTPVLSYGKTKKSLPISCYSTFLDDSLESILDVSTETRMMAVCGGGVGVHVNLRPQDKKSSGIMAHLKTYDADTLAYKQGTSRRGATAVYIDIDHPEIIQFLEMRKPTGGDANMKCLNLHHGINLTDDFMNRVYELSTNKNLTIEQKEELDKFPLINKYTNEIVEYVSAKQLWARILDIRMQTGEPYEFFIDTANEKLPEYQKALGLRINGSNLCLTGDSIIHIKTDLNSDELAIRLDEFIEKFELGFYTTVYVKSFDGNSIVWSEISNAVLTGKFDELYEIETDKGNIIRCTSNHKIFTKNRGYVEARNLLEDDELMEYT